MSQSFMRLSCVSAGILGLSVAAQGALLSGIVNVDFNNGVNGPTASGAAVIGASGDIWNGVPGGTSGSASDLLNAAGATTDVDVSFTADGVYKSNDPVNLANQALLNDFLVMTTAGTKSVVISDLSTDKTYDLYVYGGGDNNTRTLHLTVVGATTETGTTVNDTAALTYVLGKNYQKFTLAPDGSGAITINYGGGGVEGDFSGFQITPVPEPASMSLLALGGLALLRRRRC